MELDNIRYTMFKSSTSDGFRELPPSADALEQHILRSALQAGSVWGNMLSQRTSQSKGLWGWISNHDRLLIRWTGVSLDSSKLSVVTLAYKCNRITFKCTGCSCGTMHLKCIKYCSCK